MNVQNLKLIVHNAFLGAIEKDVRAIAFDYINNNTIVIYVYIDRKPYSEDYEIIDMAVTEIMAAIPNILYQKIEILETKEPIGKLKSYKGWIFIRYEPV